LTLALVATGLALVAARAPAPGESLSLRWLRTCADHPLRTSLALLLVAAALTPRRPLP